METKKTLVTFNGDIRETNEDKDFLDIVESLKVKKILTGTVVAVDEIDGLACAIIMHGLIKVAIPYSEFGIKNALVNTPSYESIKRQLEKRIGSEIDYIIRGENQDVGFAVASRLEGMRARRKKFYGVEDAQGNKRLYEGAVVEPRVVGVERGAVVLDCFGCETTVLFKDATYTQYEDLRLLFKVGTKVKAVIKSISQDNIDECSIKLSIKDAYDNPASIALRFYDVGTTSYGIVSNRSSAGVFVRMPIKGGEAYVDCLCLPTLNGVAEVGSSVIVEITNIDKSGEFPRFYGKIRKYQ